ncbi:MAG TPA: hypothetical protein VJZ27_14170, partial [Aggregatilineales bacterium]|nr:hypothetical protein [Aggregatilineales bacterium]
HLIAQDETLLRQVSSWTGSTFVYLPLIGVWFYTIFTRWTDAGYAILYLLIVTSGWIYAGLRGEVRPDISLAAAYRIALASGVITVFGVVFYTLNRTSQDVVSIDTTFVVEAAVIVLFAAVGLGIADALGGRGILAWIALIAPTIIAGGLVAAAITPGLIDNNINSNAMGILLAVIESSVVVVLVATVIYGTASDLSAMILRRVVLERRDVSPVSAAAQNLSPTSKTVRVPLQAPEYRKPVYSPRKSRSTAVIVPLVVIIGTFAFVFAVYALFIRGETPPASE